MHNVLANHVVCDMMYMLHDSKLPNRGVIERCAKVGNEVFGVDSTVDTVRGAVCRAYTAF
jgi:hypothetical protein